MRAHATTLHNLIIRNIVRQVDGRSLEAWGEQGIVRSEDIPIESRDWPHQIVQAVIEVVSSGRDAWKDDWRRKRDAYQETDKGVFGQPVPLGVADEAGELVLDTLAWHPYPARDVG